MNPIDEIMDIGERLVKRTGVSLVPTSALLRRTSLSTQRFHEFVQDMVLVGLVSLHGEFMKFHSH